jgi:hypothetical protein
MTGPITITLAGKQYQIDRLNLGQLRDLSIGIVPGPEPIEPKQKVAKWFEHAVDIIATAMRRAHPNLTSDVLFEMPISNAELHKAFADILLYAGLLPSHAKEDVQSGEAGAGAASTGPG